MSAPYDEPNITDSEGLFEFFRYVNDTAVDGLFFPVILLVIFIVVFIGTKQFRSSVAFTFSSFLCSILSLILTVLNLVNPRIMYLFFVFVGVGALWLKLER